MDAKSMKTKESHGRGLTRNLSILTVALAFSSWLYTCIQPPPPKICGSIGGPPVTATRIRLRDGRFLAYSETGVSKEDAKFKIVFSHGIIGSRLDSPAASTDAIQELGVYMVGYDRAGYGESDPNPNRSLRSEALDVEELADALNLGPRFYVMGFSVGGYMVWACLKYIPLRLEGAAFVAPSINYHWPGFPKNLTAEAYNKQAMGDQWTIKVAYYAPWLFHWWMNQAWLPSSTITMGTTFLPNQFDAKLRDQALSAGIFQQRMNVSAQQGVHESLHRDLLVMFGKWDFDPMDLEPPSVPVHLWNGDEDGFVPVTLQRYICSHLKWIKYHELPLRGHFLFAIAGFGDLLLKTLLA